MDFVSGVVLAAVLVAFVGAVCYCWRRRGRGCGGCNGCSGCSACPHKNCKSRATATEKKEVETPSGGKE